MFKNKSKVGNGFTLIEILVVIGLIAILAAIVLTAINPARQFAQARNTQRQSDINTVLNAIGQNVADFKGVWTCSPAITIGLTGTASTSAADLAPCLVPTYISSMPTDPVTSGTGYQVSVSSGLGRYMVCAPNANETALGASNPGAICLVR